MFHKQSVKSFGDRGKNTISRQYVKNRLTKNPQLDEGKIINGIRGEEFLTFIKNILTKYGELTVSEADLILSDKNNIYMFEMVFVHESYDQQLNYELFEHYGDKIVDYAISKYLLSRFPKLGDVSYNPTVALKIVSKLHLYVRSKDFLSKAGEFMGFKKYISVNDIYLQDCCIDKLYEDIFEAFMGVCDRAINSITREQVGYVICYEILKHVFDSLEISLKYEDIMDARTRLKEYVQKKASEEYRRDFPQNTYKYDFITTSSPMVYKTFIRFNLYNPALNTYQSISTNVIKTSNDQKGTEESYRQLYNYLSKYRNTPYTITNVEIVQTQEGTPLTGDPKQISVQAYIIKNGIQTVYDTGYGYDEASAKESAAENALKTLVSQGEDVTVKGWNYKDWL